DNTRPAFVGRVQWCKRLALLDPKQRENAFVLALFVSSSAFVTSKAQKLFELCFACVAGEATQWCGKHRFRALAEGLVKLVIAPVYLKLNCDLGTDCRVIGLEAGGTLATDCVLFEEATTNSLQ